jgi:hypothetical protein
MKSCVPVSNFLSPGLVSGIRNEFSETEDNHAELEEAYKPKCGYGRHLAKTRVCLAHVSRFLRLEEWRFSLTFDLLMFPWLSSPPPPLKLNSFTPLVSREWLELMLHIWEVPGCRPLWLCYSLCVLLLLKSSRVGQNWKLPAYIKTIDAYNISPNILV